MYRAIHIFTFFKFFKFFEFFTSFTAFLVFREEREELDALFTKRLFSRKAAKKGEEREGYDLLGALGRGFWVLGGTVGPVTIG
ncbi:MAG: hypothetical protein ABSF61_10735 [Anaerolineales bacterium]|jgi:hypothetical protein